MGLHREWFQRSAPGRSLGVEYRVIAESPSFNPLYDDWLVHSEAVFDHLVDTCRDSHIIYDVLLMILTSTYFLGRSAISVGRPTPFGYSRVTGRSG